MTLTGCPSCDRHGPNLPTVLNEGTLQLHRALHDAWYLLTQPIKNRLIRN